MLQIKLRRWCSVCTIFNLILPLSSQKQQLSWDWLHLCCNILVVLPIPISNILDFWFLHMYVVTVKDSLDKRRPFLKFFMILCHDMLINKFYSLFLHDGVKIYQFWYAKIKIADTSLYTYSSTCLPLQIKFFGENHFM